MIGHSLGRRHRLLGVAGLAMSLVLAIQSHGDAATIDWRGNATTTAWATGTNWVGDVAPTNNTTTDVARFNQTGYLSQPNAGTRSITGVVIGDGVTSTAALTISGTSLTIGASGIDMQANSAATVVSSAVVLGAGQTWSNSSTNNLTVSGLVSGSNNLAKSGSGTLVLSNNSNSFTTTGAAGINITGGTLSIGNTAHLGNSGNDLTLNGGTLQTTATATLANVRSIAIGSSGGAVSVSGGFLTVQGVVTGPGNTLTKTGGDLVLQNTSGSLSTANINISAGRVLFGSGSSATEVANSVGNGTISVAGRMIFATSAAYTLANANVTLVDGAGIGGRGTSGNVSFAAASVPTAGAVVFPTAGLTIFNGDDQNTVPLNITGSAFTTMTGNRTLQIANSTVQGGIALVTIAGTIDTSGHLLTLDTTDDATPQAVANKLTLNGTISGAGGLTKSGIHGATLNAANTYTGGTIVNAGTLTMGNATALGSTSGQLTVNGGVLNMGSQNLTVGNLTGTGGTISGTSVGTRTLTIGQGNGTGGNFQGVIANGTGGTTALTKTGTGTITLSGANSYTGATAIDAGTLLVNGSLASGSIVTVGLSGTLGGNGTVNGATTINGALTPGNSPGVLAFTNTLTLNGTATFEIDGLNRGSEYDGVNTGAGLLTYGGGLAFDFGTTLSGNQTFDLFNIGGGGQTGNFTTVALTGNYTGSLARSGSVWSLTDGGGNNWSFSQTTGVLNFVAVPEPATIALLASAVGLLGFRIARRRRAKS